MQFFMRDDLHKRVPIPPRLRSLLQMAMREADRSEPERLELAARDALLNFVRANLSKQVLGILQACPPQGQLFPITALPKQAKSPLEDAILRGIEQDFVARDQKVILKSAIKAENHSFIREVQSTFAAESYKASEGKASLSAFSCALESAADYVANYLCVAAMPMEKSPPLHLDTSLPHKPAKKQ